MRGRLSVAFILLLGAAVSANAQEAWDGETLISPLYSSDTYLMTWI